MASERILVVDDETSMTQYLSIALTKAGYEVTAVNSGAEALERARADTFTVAITDVKMPGMDGIELMRKVREKLGHLAVVVMTAFGSVENAVAAMQQGANDYLTKPLNFQELLLVVRNVLAHVELRRENERLREALLASPAEADSTWIGSSTASRRLRSTHLA